MCTVSINIDEVALRDLFPELENAADIRSWVQDLIDWRLHQLKMEEEETVGVEEARAMVLETVRKEYTKP